MVLEALSTQVPFSRDLEGGPRMLRRRSLFSLYLPGRKDWAGVLATGVPVDRGINTSSQHGLDLGDSSDPLDGHT